MFVKYPSLKRLGSVRALEGIDQGTVHVYPKLDGTNASVWMDAKGNLKAGSRNRELTLPDGDNAGFNEWVLQNEYMFTSFFKHYPSVTLYGEWLVPHTLKTYKEEAWRKFYVFDVYCREQNKLLNFNDYIPAFEYFTIDYTPCLAVLENPSEEQFQRCLQKNTFLVTEGIGEGIVIKNFEWEGDTWAKLVDRNFGDKHVKTMGPYKMATDVLEQKIVDEFVTAGLVSKEKHKIENFSVENTGEVLGRVFNALIEDEMWAILKKFKNPTINFRELQKRCIYKTKEFL